MLPSKSRLQTLLTSAAVGAAAVASAALLASLVRTLRREPLELDDNTLSAKVMSELFSDPDLPKGAIDVNSEHGVVVLRGQVRTPETIRLVESRVLAIAGVREVRNLLHLPKTRARMATGKRVTRRSS